MSRTLLTAYKYIIVWLIKGFDDEYQIGIADGSWDIWYQQTTALADDKTIKVKVWILMKALVEFQQITPSRRIMFTGNYQINNEVISILQMSFKK